MPIKLDLAAPATGARSPALDRHQAEARTGKWLLEVDRALFALDRKAERHAPDPATGAATAASAVRPPVPHLPVDHGGDPLPSAAPGSARAAAVLATEPGRGRAAEASKGGAAQAQPSASAPAGDDAARAASTAREPVAVRTEQAAPGTGTLCGTAAAGPAHPAAAPAQLAAAPAVQTGADLAHPQPGSTPRAAGQVAGLSAGHPAGMVQAAGGLSGASAGGANPAGHTYGTSGAGSVAGAPAPAARPAAVPSVSLAPAASVLAAGADSGPGAPAFAPPAPAADTPDAAPSTGIRRPPPQPPYARSHLHVMEDAQGLRAWVRDASLTPAQERSVAQAVAAGLAQQGPVAAVSVNGRVAAAAPRFGDRFDFEPVADDSTGPGETAGHSSGLPFLPAVKGAA